MSDGRFDVDAAIAYLRAADPKLAQVIDRSTPYRIERRPGTSMFISLARAIVYQQLSGKAAASIFRRFCDMFPGKRRGLNARRLLEIPNRNLRAAGLSRNKALALQDLAERTLRGDLPNGRKLKQMSDEEIVAALTQVRGIGVWTAQMFLMFYLGRPDVLAVDDLGLRQGHAVVLGRDEISDRRSLHAYAERWRPYRSVASWYLWRAVELARDGGRAL